MIIIVIMWRYSPRNGDGSLGRGSKVKAASIWRYSPRNGDGSYIQQVLSYHNVLFGDIVPGMGTEATLIPYLIEIS